MDIIDYTTIARRRLRLLVGVPLVVALIVVPAGLRLSERS